MQEHEEFFIKNGLGIKPKKWTKEHSKNVQDFIKQHKNRKIMRIEKVIVTPKLAAAYLNRNKNNRKINTKIVAKYAADIKNNKWKEDTGELIKISTDGNLIDGQHRLSAIVEAKKSIFLHIAFDVSPDVFDILDTGKPRSAADVFHMQGVNYSTQLPSMISTFLRLESGKFPNREIFTNQRVYSEYLDNSAYWDSLAIKTYSFYLSFSKILPPSVIGGVYAHIDKNKNKEMQEGFIKQLCTGVDIKNKTMITLRNVLISDKMKKRNKMNNTEKVSLIIRAWNAFIVGRELKRLSVTSSKFPVTKLAKPE